MCQGSDMSQQSLHDDCFKLTHSCVSLERSVTAVLHIGLAGRKPVMAKTMEVIRKSSEPWMDSWRTHLDLSMFIEGFPDQGHKNIRIPQTRSKDIPLMEPKWTITLVCARFSGFRTLVQKSSGRSQWRIISVPSCARSNP